MNQKTIKKIKKAVRLRDSITARTSTSGDIRRIKKVYNKIPRNERGDFLTSLLDIG